MHERWVVAPAGFYEEAAACTLLDAKVFAELTYKAMREGVDLAVERAVAVTAESQDRWTKLNDTCLKKWQQSSKNDHIRKDGVKLSVGSSAKGKKVDGESVS
jgi:hypothetical protein